LELIILPLILGIIAFFLPTNWVRPFGLLASLSVLGVSLVHLMNFDPENYVLILNPAEVFPLGLTFKMGYDGLALTMVLLTNAVISIILLANWNRDISSNGRFTGLTLLMQCALLGLFTSLDGILFYTFWELTLIPIFLILYWFGKQDNNRALFKFFLYTLLGSLMMLLSFIGLAYFSPNFSYFQLVQANFDGKAVEAALIMGGILFAFAVKIPLFPFHTWQAPTYTNAPMAGTMLLSALMLKMALYGMIKWMIPIGFEGLVYLKWPVITLGGIGIVYGAIIAMKQKDLKTLFAYASISHLGLIAAGIMLFTVSAIEASMVQIINHSIVAVALFLCAGIIEDRLNTRNIDDLGGIAKVAPHFGFWFAVMTFISVSVPFTAGFIGEFILIKELFTAHWVIGITAASTLVFGAVYMLRAYQGSMFGPSKVTVFADLTWNEYAVFGILTLAAVGFGLYPQVIIDFIKPSVKFTQELMSGDLTFTKK
jgi:NADH-quinone oxidoreductase subunit M